MNSQIISVVIPVYNAAKYLREALDSVLSQSYSNLEVICVNDGSKDESLMILQEYAARDKRIKVLDGPNGGYGKAMNRGLAASTGTYFAIFEPDDILPAGAYLTLIELANKHSAQIAKGCINSFSGDGAKRNFYNETKFRTCFTNRVIKPRDELDFFKAFMNTVTSLYRLDFLREHSIKYNETPGAAYQDNGMFFLSMSYADRVVCTNEIVYHYRQDNTSSSMHLMGDRPFVFTKEYAYIRTFLEKTPDVWKKVSPMFLLMRIWSHMTIYQRIRESAKLQYLEELQKELTTMEDIDTIYLTKYDKWFMSSLLQSPMIYLLSENLASMVAEKITNNLEQPAKPGTEINNLFYRKTQTKMIYKFLGVPVWGKRFKNGKIIYSLFGIPVKKVLDID